MIVALWIFGSLLAVLTFGSIMLPSSGKYTPRHNSGAAINAYNMTTRGSINYTGNPYRVGAYVYVMENASPSQYDWNGTYLGMSNGMAMIRDQESLVVTHVNRDQLYSAHH